MLIPEWSKQRPTTGFEPPTMGRSAEANGPQRSSVESTDNASRVRFHGATAVKPGSLSEHSFLVPRPLRPQSG